MVEKALSCVFLKDPDFIYNDFSEVPNWVKNEVKTREKYHEHILH